MSLKYEKSCGAVIFKDELVLLIQNKKSKHWSFPKGHKENNETDLETAYREVLEETSLNILIDPTKFEVINYMPAINVSKDVVYFKATYSQGELIPQESEIIGIGWFKIEDALQKITFDQEKQVLISILNKK